MNSDRKAEQKAEPIIVLTVGHSTRPIAEFLDILKAHHVSQIVDVRAIPRSRTNPQFNREVLAESLAQAGVQYTHMPGLGGLRKAKADSTNNAWRNASFRGFADYMQTPEFEKNIEELLILARQERIAVMCAEAVHWRCHRSLIADAVTVRGVPIEHIIDRSSRKPHKITSFARTSDACISYPGAPEMQTD